MPHHASSPGPPPLFDAGAASRLLGPAPGDDLERKTQDGRLARVLVVDDDAEAASLLRTELARLPLDVHVAASGEEAVQALRDRPVDVVIADLRAAGADGLDVVRAATRLQPPAKVIVITGSGSGTSPAEAAQAGAFDCVRKPFDVEALARVMQRALRAAGRSCTLGLPGGEDGQPRGPFGDLVGGGPEMQAVFRFIERAAGSDISVLITGESGTGKELVARAIHRQNPRRRGAFVAINCAGIPETLLESELFGYARGAFTGASAARKGLLEEAQGGTVFLDEIAEMPMLLQAKVLRVLQDREVRPLGANHAMTVDFRVIAASNKDLRARVACGRFREDLFFRLNVASIHLPPLRERREDLPVLVQSFLEKHAAAQGRAVSGVSREAMRQLEAYGWPGNVRELQNAIERAVAFARGEVIQPDDLPAFLARPDGSLLDRACAQQLTLRALEEQYVERVCRHVDGDLERAAAILGVHPRTLRRRAQRRKARQ